MQQGSQPGLGGQGTQPAAAASSGVQTDCAPAAQHDLPSDAAHLVVHSVGAAWSVAGCVTEAALLSFAPTVGLAFTLNATTAAASNKKAVENSKTLFFILKKIG